jgi:hypothetical protein
MISYASRKQSASGVALTAATPVKLFATNTPRFGYAVWVPAGVTLYIKEIPAGTTAPTAGQMNAGQVEAITGPLQYESGARETADIYGLTAAPVTLYPEEIIGQ